MPASRRRTFEPAPGEPGSRIRLEDGRTVEVWSLAPGRDVYALTDGGAMLRVLNAKGRHTPRVRADITPGQQRVDIVAGVVQARAGVIAAALAPTPTGLPWDAPERVAAAAAYQRARAWAAARLAHELYPAHYPTPAPFATDTPAPAYAAG